MLPPFAGDARAISFGGAVRVSANVDTQRSVSRTGSTVLATFSQGAPERVPGPVRWLARSVSSSLHLDK